MTEGRYTERIARGAALLDEKVPGWREKIDLDKLELSNCTTCVLGQLSSRPESNTHPDWLDILEEFGFDWSNGEDADDHGFNFAEEENGWSFTQLTAEWKSYIEATRLTEAQEAEIMAAETIGDYSPEPGNEDVA